MEAFKENFAALELYKKTGWSIVETVNGVGSFEQTVQNGVTIPSYYTLVKIAP